jgi:hypothetical protein
VKKSEAFDFITDNREEIEEVFQDLIDLGYEFKISTYHTNDNFSEIRSKILDRIPSYYYGFEISLEKKTDSDSDERNHRWDGSFFYEESTNILDEIHKSIGRFKKTYNYKIYYTLRNLNNIEIRVIMGHHKNENILYNIEKIEKYILNLEDKEIDGYEIRPNWYSGNEKHFNILCKKRFDPKEKFSNREDFTSIFDNILEEFMEILGDNFKHTGDKSHNYERCYIFSGKDDNPVRVLEMKMIMNEPEIEERRRAGRFIKIGPKFKIEIFKEASIKFTVN